MSHYFQGLGDCARGAIECAGCHPVEGVNSCIEGLNDILGDTVTNEFWYVHNVADAASLIESDVLMNVVSKDGNPTFFENPADNTLPNCSNGMTFGAYPSGDAPYPPPAEGQDTNPNAVWTKYSPDTPITQDGNELLSALTKVYVNSSRKASSDFASTFNQCVSDDGGVRYCIGAGTTAHAPDKLNFWVKLSNFKVYSPFNIPMMTITDGELTACTMHYKLIDGTTGIYDYDLPTLNLPQGDFNYWSVNLKRLCKASYNGTSHKYEQLIFNSSDQPPQSRVPEVLVNIPTIYLGQGSYVKPGISFKRYNNWWVGGGASDVVVREDPPTQGWVNGNLSDGRRTLAYVSEDGLYKFNINFYAEADGQRTSDYRSLYSVNKRASTTDDWPVDFYSIPCPKWLIPPS